jgi:hypothetical protein
MSNATENELLETVAKMHGLSVTEYLMRRAVPDSLMAEIVADGRRGISNSASMIPDHERNKPVVKRGTGWVNAAPIRQPSGAEPGGLIDQMVEADTQRQRQEAVAKTVKLNLEMAETLRLLDLEQERRDKELDPVNCGLYDDPDKA